MENLDEWFLAEIVLLVTNKSRANCRTHVNFVLVQATSVEDAYSKAIELGSMENNTFESQRGELIDVAYKGLKNLHQIYEPTLSHGAELLFEQLEDCTEESIAALLRPKHQLNAFTGAKGRSIARG